MNYTRTKLRAELQKKIKEALLEKRAVLRNASAGERAKLERLIIRKVTEEFAMGHSSKKKKGAKDGSSGKDTKKDQDVEKSSEADSADRSASGESAASEDSQDSQETPDAGSDAASSESKSLEDMSEDELRAYAEEKGIKLGNASSKNGMIKKIKKASE